MWLIGYIFLKIVANRVDNVIFSVYIMQRSAKNCRIYARRWNMNASQVTTRIPSTAAMTTLITGIFFTWFGLLECATEFMTRQLRLHEAVADVAESVAFGMSFIMLAWILWARPRIGGFLLVVAGLSFAVWMYHDWSSPESLIDWAIRALITLVPVGMGIFSLTREYRNKVSYR